jgi:hypothetical protein
MKPHPAHRAPIRTPLQRRLAIMVANWRAGPLWWTVPFLVLVILGTMLMVVIFWLRTQTPGK